MRKKKSCRLISANQVQFLSHHMAENGDRMVPNKKIKMQFLVEHRTTKTKQELTRQMELKK